MNCEPGRAAKTLYPSLLARRREDGLANSQSRRRLATAPYGLIQWLQPFNGGAVADAKPSRRRPTAKPFNLD